MISTDVKITTDEQMCLFKNLCIYAVYFNFNKRTLVLILTNISRIHWNEFMHLQGVLARLQLFLGLVGPHSRQYPPSPHLFCHVDNTWHTYENIKRRWLPFVFHFFLPCSIVSECTRYGLKEHQLDIIFVLSRSCYILF